MADKKPAIPPVFIGVGALAVSAIAGYITYKYLSSKELAKKEETKPQSTSPSQQPQSTGSPTQQPQQQSTPGTEQGQQPQTGASSGQQSAGTSSPYASIFGTSSVLASNDKIKVISTATFESNDYVNIVKNLSDKLIGVINLNKGMHILDVNLNPQLSLNDMKYTAIDGYGDVVLFIGEKPYYVYYVKFSEPNKVASINTKIASSDNLVFPPWDTINSSITLRYVKGKYLSRYYVLFAGKSVVDGDAQYSYNDGRFSWNDFFSDPSTCSGSAGSSSESVPMLKKDLGDSIIRPPAPLCRNNYGCEVLIAGLSGALYSVKPVPLKSMTVPNFTPTEVPPFVYCADLKVKKLKVYNGKAYKVTLYSDGTNRYAVVATDDTVYFEKINMDKGEVSSVDTALKVTGFSQAVGAVVVDDKLAVIDATQKKLSVYKLTKTEGGLSANKLIDVPLPDVPADMDVFNGRLVVGMGKKVMIIALKQQ